MTITIRQQQAFSVSNPPEGCTEVRTEPRPQLLEFVFPAADIATSSGTAATPPRLQYGSRVQRSWGRGMLTSNVDNPRSAVQSPTTTSESTAPRSDRSRGRAKEDLEPRTAVDHADRADTGNPNRRSVTTVSASVAVSVATSTPTITKPPRRITAGRLRAPQELSLADFEMAFSSKFGP